MNSYIKKHFGTIQKCADELGVSTRTVSNWIHRNPKGILKHGIEITAKKDTTWMQLQGEVEFCLEALEREKQS